MAARTKPAPEAEDEPPIEGTAVVVRESSGGDPGPERGLQTFTPVQGHLAVGVGALASMSDEAFEHNLQALAKGVQRAAQVKRAIMVADEDFGLIPGTNKPTLLKPGAEKLALAYGLVGRFTHHIRYGDGEIDPPINVVVDSFIHLGDTSGPVVAQGMGMASSWEKRYRYRGAAGRHCPKCGKDNVIRSRNDRGGWWCGTRDGGCGQSFLDGDATIEGQEDPGKAEIEDPYELGNTLLKMAEKRAYVDGVLRATASSGLFTQDMEDRGAGGGAPPPPGNAAPPPATAPRTVGPAATAPVVASAPTSTPAAAPAASGEVVEFQGPALEAPDGIRRVKPDSDQSRRHGVVGPIDKLEVKLTVGKSKHTAMVFGDLAVAVDALQIKVGEVVSIYGVLEKHEWEVGKPPQKQIWAITQVAILRGDQWITANPLTLGQALLAEEPPAPAGVVPTAAGPSASDDEPPLPPRPTVAPLPDMRLDDEVTGTLELRIAELRFGEQDGRKYGSFKGTHASGEILRCLVGDEPPGELKEVLGDEANPVYKVGMDVRVVGYWRGGWVVVSAIGIKPL